MADCQTEFNLDRFRKKKKVRHSHEHKDLHVHVHGSRRGSVGGGGARLDERELPHVSIGEQEQLPTTTDPQVGSPGDVAEMDPTHLTPRAADGEKKQRATRDARDMAESVRRICERNNVETPPYEFLELIGKGTSGRVYKSRDLRNGRLVALKIMNTDEIDYSQAAQDKDVTIADFRKEITALQQLKESNAKNINVIQEAFDLQEQLWIVSEYCTGGSIRTLLRATPPSQSGLEEEYIIPIARELAVAVKGVHDNHRIHRDIKCTNVYVTEEGDIQLGDFGIVGVTDGPDSKRRTVVGTPHWMSREVLNLTDSGEGYGKEVDIWSYGCTIYEMATGNPPNSRIHLGDLPNALTSAPRLEGGNYSQELRAFIAFCLNSDPEERPTADAILKHPYVAGTSKKYPTRSLTNVIDRYKAWEYDGGVRASLFLPGGAPPPPNFQDQSDFADTSEFGDWNFSTSDGFNEDFEKRYSQMTAVQGSYGLRIDTSNGSDLQPIVTRDLTPLERAQQEMSATRGERSLGRLWDPHSAPYELHTPIDNARPMSDLPLRDFPAGQPRESVIDLDALIESDVPTFNFDFGEQTLKPGRLSNFARDDEEEDDYQYSRPQEDDDRRATKDWKFPTIDRSKIETAKRATMDWTFPSAEPTEPEDPDLKMNLPPVGEEGEVPPGFRPQLKHTATVPLGQFHDFIHTTKPVQGMSGSPTRDSMASMIDLDLGRADTLELRRPSTASSTAESIMTDMTSGNPFDLEEDPEQRRLDRNRYSSHKQYRSEGGMIKRSSGRVPMHSRGNSLSSTESDIERQFLAADDMPGFEYNYNMEEDPSRRLNGTAGFDGVDLPTLPKYTRSGGFDEIRSWTDGLDDMAHASLTGQNGERVTRSRQPSTVSTVSIVEPDEIEFPQIMAPNPEALQEDAHPEIVISELDRLLADFGECLKATSRAIQQRAEVYVEDEDGGMASENENGQTREDEEIF